MVDFAGKSTMIFDDFRTQTFKAHLDEIPQTFKPLYTYNHIYMYSIYR